MKNRDSNEALDLNEALERITAMISPPFDAETVPLQSALGRVSPHDIKARFASPPFASSAMDGYAIADSSDKDVVGRRFRVVGESAAGKPFERNFDPEDCIRIFTGAAVPPTARRVILQEDCLREGAFILINGDPEARSNIRPTGHDINAGERLVSRGRLITPVDLGRLATDGRASVEVSRRLRVGVFSTGDELIDPANDGPLPFGCIYESNRQTLLGLLGGLPVERTDLGNLPDTADATRQALHNASRDQDFIITSGGVSVGDHDHVKAAVESLGSLHFWKLNLKPGKPLAFGQIGKAWFCGLPGNPVSAIVTWLLVARPAVLAACGVGVVPPLKIPALLSTTVAHKPGRTEYQRGQLTWNGEGDSPHVAIHGDQSSNRLSTFQDTNCLIEIPKNSGDLVAGTKVAVLPFAAF